ncbi:MAG: hypothetical protein ACF8PG_01345 [Maioricimonas sp. JB045]
MEKKRKADEKRARRLSRKQNRDADNTPATDEEGTTSPDEST